MPDLRKRLRHARDFALLYAIYRLGGTLPWGALGAWGRALGSAAWRVAPVRKRVALENLAYAFGDSLDREGIEKLGRRFYQELGTTLLEFCAFRRLDAARVRALTRIDNGRHLETLRAEGRGALLVSGHLGNWELLGAAVAARGYPIRFLAKTQANPHLDRLQNELRRRVGVGIIRVGPSLKEMIRALRRGEFIGLLGDQDAGASGYFTRFLGRPASVFRGPGVYAHRFGCPVLTGFIARQSDGTHRISFNDPHYPQPDWDETTAVARLTEAHTRELEAAVRANPAAYFWVHRRWKTLPPARGESADQASVWNPMPPPD